MQISKHFHDAIDPKAPSSVSMRVALGLLCRRKIEDMTPSEHAELAHRDGAAATFRRFLYDVPQQTLHRRFHWLLNVTLKPVDVPVVRDSCFVPVPTLSIAGFNIIRIARGDHAGRRGDSRRSGDESSNILTLNFSTRISRQLEASSDPSLTANPLCAISTRTRAGPASRS
jgi:hypothetical protein